MKFDRHEYWKHENGMDCFIKIIGVAFDDNGKDAIVNACWMTQGRECFWFASPSHRIKIDPDNYDKWHPYEPIGKLKL